MVPDLKTHKLLFMCVNQTKKGIYIKYNVRHPMIPCKLMYYSQTERIHAMLTLASLR